MTSRHIAPLPPPPLAPAERAELHIREARAASDRAFEITKRLLASLRAQEIADVE